MTINVQPTLAANKRGRPRQRRSTRAPRDSPGAFVNDAWSLSKRAIRGINELRKLINTEFKFVDITGSGSVITQSGAFAHITSIAQGTDVSQRTGDSLKTQYIEFKAHLLINNSATRTMYRVIVFRDLENTGSVPVGTDLLKQAGTGNAPTSPFTYANLTRGDVPNRFTILLDEIGTLCINGQENAVLDFASHLTQHVRYSSTGAGNVREGALFVAFFSNESTNTPTVDWDIRLFYTDD